MLPIDSQIPANPALSRAQIALRLLTAAATAKSPVSTPQQAGQSDLSAISKPVLSPAAWNAIFDASAPPNPVRPVSGLPDGVAQFVSALGADGWKPHDFGDLSVARMSDENFSKIVLDSILPNYASNESFSRALDNGTLKIERAENTQLMGTLKTYQLDFYRNGSYFGGGSTGSGELNKAFIDDLTARGVNSTYGYINDQWYLVTWPLGAPGA